MSNSKKLFFVLSSFTAILFLIIIFFSSRLSSNTFEKEDKSNVYVENGIQYIDIAARGGYTPNLTNAKGNQETVLRITTKNTFDCSSAFFIPQLNITKNLPQSGVTEINLGKVVSGTKLVGTCSMGMYSLSINFN
jgi:plastocyanin domain-containing protein